MATVARAQQISNKPLIDITGYVIDATVIPATHELHCTAKVSFTALDALPVATFELHAGLKVSKVTDAADHPSECRARSSIDAARDPGRAAGKGR